MFFFCSVDLTTHCIKGVRVTAFQQHDYTALGGGQQYRGVFLEYVDHINTKWRLVSQRPVRDMIPTPAVAN